VCCFAHSISPTTREAIKKCLLVFLLGCILLGATGCIFVGSLFFSPSSLVNPTFSPYSFHVAITVSDLSQNIIFDQAPAGMIEYAWGARIDTDANAGTGDASGFDVDIIFHNYSLGSGPNQGQLATLFDPPGLDRSSTFFPECFSWDAGGSYWSPLYASGDYTLWVDSTVAGNAINIYFHVFDALPTMAPGYRTQFHTLYYTPLGSTVTDETSVVTGNGSTSDIEGDAGGYSFIDIRSAEIKYIP
jgi:hypothetical protein